MELPEALRAMPEGRYSFTQLPPATYTLAIQASGFESIPRPASSSTQDSRQPRTSPLQWELRRNRWLSMRRPLS
jgi:hypothetical protein